MGRADDVLGLLAKRAQLVRQLSDGRKSARELEQRLMVSRATVTRALKSLENSHLVQKTGDHYELTSYGRLAHESYQRMIDRHEPLMDAKPLLDHLPAPNSIPAVVFDDAAVLQPKPDAPEAPRKQFLDRVRQSVEIVVSVPILSEQLVSVFYDRLTAHNLQLSLVVDHQLTQHLFDVYRERLDMALESGHCTLWSITEMPPFSLAVVDREELWLGVYDECGQLQGIIRTEAAAAVEWADQRLEHYTEHARLLGQQELIGAAD